MFEPGQEVQLRNNPDRRGVVTAIGTVHAGVQYYAVFWGALGSTNVPEYDLVPVAANQQPHDHMRTGKLSGYETFLRNMTYHRLMKSHPLRDTIYAFNASRTRFYTYQFKPLLKFLDSEKHRILIADEVGLGKTIEAGMILTELRARQSVERVLIVCPSSLREKWKMELKKRFDEDFTIHNTPSFMSYLAEYERNPERTRTFSIISLEAIRSERVLQRIEELSPHFDLVVIDEAHHMRNFGRAQRTAGKLLGQSSDAMLLMTATPVMLGEENLFSLLNIMDEEEFPDFNTTSERFRANIPVIKAQTCLAQMPPNLTEALRILTGPGVTSWLTQDVRYSSLIERLRTFGAWTGSPGQHRLFHELQRDLAGINLIGHIYTRSRKREVHTNFATRIASSDTVQFTETEMAFYEEVTEIVREESAKRGHLPIIQQWCVNGVQRRMASSIPALIAHYKNTGMVLDDDGEDGWTDIFDSDEDANTPSAEGLLMNNPRFLALIATYPGDAKDSKYEVLREILLRLKDGNDGKPIKIMIFAFFKGTLYYLQRRLKADGFRVNLVCGDVDMKLRPDIVESFSKDPDVEILLSSRVGSEGLDFQFCHNMVNYDLPWNPMEVEQRIGRLDRIGQNSQTINIFNLWVEDTIEGRILRRLYERVGIFKSTIGDLEAILGKIMQELHAELFRKKLTKEEEEEMARIAELNLSQQKDALERLESESAQFIGADQFFMSEIDSIHDKRRYITGQQLRSFLMHYLSEVAPNTRMHYNETKEQGKLEIAQDLRQLLQQHQSGQGSFDILGRSQLQITFDADAAFRNPHLEFINILHPIPQTFLRIMESNGFKSGAASFIRIKTKRLAEGYHFFYVFRLKVYSAKSRNTLECIILNDELDPACSPDDMETVFGEMLERGEDPTHQLAQLDPDDMDKAYEAALHQFLEIKNQIKEAEEQRNEAFIAQRLKNLEVYYERQIRKHKRLIERNPHSESYVRMQGGIISRFETEWKLKRVELERQRNVHAEFDEIAAGVLQVTAPMEDA